MCYPHVSSSALQKHGNFWKPNLCILQLLLINTIWCKYPAAIEFSDHKIAKMRFSLLSDTCMVWLLFGCRTCFLVLFLFNLKNFWFCDCNIGKYYSCWNKFWHPCGLPRSSLEKYLTRWPLDHFRSSYEHSKKNKQNITHSSLFCSQSQNYGSHRCFPQLKKFIFLIYQQHKVYIFIFCLSPSEFFTSKSLMPVKFLIPKKFHIFHIPIFKKTLLFLFNLNYSISIEKNLINLLVKS